MRNRWPILVLLCVLASLLVPGIASASTAPGAETRVGAFDLQDRVGVGVERSLTLELRPRCEATYDQLASDSLLAARGGSSLLTHMPAAGRKANQLARRGWTREAINETVNNPFTTRAATNRATGNAATAFFRKDGSHVIRDNVTGDLVQMSDRANPANWIPDSSIVNPYLPGQ